LKIPLIIPGHYATPCGGCDTIKTPDRVYQIVAQATSVGSDVLYEGIIVQDDTTRALALSRAPGVDFSIIALTTPIEDCLAAIRDRRAARGDDRPLDEKNTRERARRVESGLRKMEASGAKVYRLDREGAFLKVKELLGL